MNKSMKNVRKFLFLGIISAIILLAGSCDNWMSNDNFMSDIEKEVHDANASAVSVYVRYANQKMGTTEPQGNTTMKVDVPSKISAVTSEEYGFVKWAAFSSNDFATNKQHSGLVYLGEDEYNTNFKPKELGSNVIKFEEPTNPVTKVKIFTKRSDIFIVPIVAARPTYVQSVPANADYNVVKNTSIRILFSKAIDKSTLLDSEGNYNYSITSSAAVLTDDDNEMEAKDITDFFDYSLSASGKMLTLTLKKEQDGTFKQLLDNRQRITVTLFEGICDKYGYSMNGNYTFSFQTGTSTDSLAPMIEVLVAGKDIKSIGKYVSLKNGEIDGKATTAAKNAPRDITGADYTDSLIAQRVYDKLYIYVKANDVIASGNADINPAKDLSEDNVAFIGISASLYVDKDGNAVPADTAETTIARKNNVYISGQFDSNVKTDEIFTDVIPLDKNGLKYSGGTIYTYDVSSLPDGLIKIDVWGIDMVGNTGIDEKSAAAYYTKHDNGYKSIFIVKDTTAPDSKAQASKIKSSSDDAPYYWYKADTLNSMELYDLESDPVTDKGHEKLRSLNKNLSWVFVTDKTKASKAPAANDSAWKFIHDKDTGASIKYRLDSANAPEKDGPIDITLFIRDDIGNVSEPVLLNSIMYDNTKPTVTLKDAYGDFVTESGVSAMHNSKSAVISQILKVDCTELNDDDTGSGIRRIEIHVKKGDTEVAVPLSDTFKVKWSNAQNATPATAKDIPVALNDSASTANLKVLNVNDSSKITSGTLFIYGIKLGDEDGKYTVYVDLFDSALNKTEKTAHTIIARDTTPPKVNKVKVVGAKARKVYEQTEETWWMPNEYFEGSDLNKVTFLVTADEAGSGLKKIKLAQDIEFTSASKIKNGDAYLAAGTDYTLDTTNNEIILLDHYNTVLLNGESNAPIQITLENVKYNKLNAASGNKAAIFIQDFVENTAASNNVDGTEDYQIYFDDENETAGTIVYADSLPPEITLATIEDSEKDSNPDNIRWNKDDYTSSQNVILTIKLAAESAVNGSGVKKVSLTDNAKFTENTVIKVNGVELASDKYKIADNFKSVEFNEVFTEETILTFTDVCIATNGMGEGSHIVKADLTDFVGLETLQSKETNPIIWDQTSPTVDPSNVNWVTEQTGVTVGSEKDWLIDTQALKISFTEETAGVKIIKFNIHLNQDGAESYTNPFTDSVFKLYYNDTLLNYNTDYQIEDKYIILTEPKKTGDFKFTNIKLTDSDVEGIYMIDVVLLDAAENKVDCNQYIVVDKIAPVITQRLSVPDLINTVEITTSGLGTPKKFLPRNYIGAGNNKAPDSIPVYFTIEEENSGVKVITFGGDVKLSSATQLWKVGENGQEEEVSSSIYQVNTENNTITLNSLDALKKVRNPAHPETPVQFQILVKNVGLKNEDTASAASVNVITATVADVAMNVSEQQTTAYSPIYSDSRVPDAPQNLVLVDRDPTPIKATKGYTNESKIDMQFQLSDCESTGSGYHKFKLSGATFTSTSTLTMTSSNVALQGYEFELSENNTVLTLKKDDTLLGVKQAVNVTITDIQLNIANPTDVGEKTVGLTCYDLVGWNTSEVTAKIIFDNQAPACSTGPFAANYTGTGRPSYYVPSVNVYPHADAENGHGVGITMQVNGTDTQIPTFYTSTTYLSNKTSTNGVVDAGNDFGVVLGFRATDNISLGGYNSNDSDRYRPFIYYVKDNNFDKTIDQILVIANNPAQDINGKIGLNGNGNSPTSESLWFGFTTGKYSAVIVDEAGNYSNIIRFNIVKDTTKPAKINMNLVTIEKPAGADIYRYSTNNTEPIGNFIGPFATSFADSEGSGGNTSNPYIWKYVIKQTKNENEKYKLIIKLNGTDLNDELINGNSVSTQASYTGNLSYTDSAAPIEKYAISTWYGGWITSSAASSASACQPAVPMGTILPDGTVLDSKSKSSDLRNYFEYELGDSYLSSYISGSSWLISANNAGWHDFVKNQPVTDSGNQIVSYLNDDNNLVIELPNTVANTLPPISIFLRDACGNTEYVVIRHNESSQWPVAFNIDNKLGWKVTDNNYEVIEPVIIQNSCLIPGTSGYTWNGTTYKWNKQSGNHESTNTEDGNTNNVDSGIIGFAKDMKQLATYYNDSPKIGLTLRFGEDNNPGNHDFREAVLFSGNNQMSTDTTNEYTCRAMIYCTKDSEKPDYSTITGSKTLENVTSNATGFRSDWTAIKGNSGTSEITIVLDYPKPDYTKLTTWTKNSDNGEPVPYYIWYLFEDRVGNYEIAKVVNSAATGEQLRTSTKGMYDRWFYDGAAPKITIRGTDTELKDISSTKTLVDALLPMNNGYIPCLDGNKVYLSSNNKIRNVSLLNNTYDTVTTTHHVENTDENTTEGEENRKYMMFMDLHVEESTGIRAFSWSTSSTAPAFNNDYVLSDGNTQGDNGTHWYAGYKATGIDAWIGCNFTYPGDSSNAYYSFTDDSSSYKGIYSGTKLNTVMPVNLLNESTATTLYLHVMDWTGNIASYRVGQNLEFIKDDTPPEYKYAGTDGTTNPSMYYIKKETGSAPAIRFAGGQNTAASRGEDIDVYIPTDYFTEDVIGYAITKNETSSIINKSGKYLSVSEQYYHRDTLYYYVYDRVGNANQLYMYSVYDDEGPYLSFVELSTKNSDDYMVDSTGKSRDKSYGGEQLPYYANPDDIPATDYPSVFVNNTNCISFSIKDILSAPALNDCVYDLASVELWESTSSGWTKKVSLPKVVDQGDYEISCSDYDIGYDTEGKIYLIMATDISGNVSCKYVKLAYDNAKPVFNGNPVVTITKGSLNEYDSTNHYYAFTCDTNHVMTLTVNITDSGAGSVYNHFEYKVDNGSWTSFTGNSFDIIAYANKEIQKIYVRDVFENETTDSDCPKFKYSKDENTSVTNIAKLKFYGGTIALPSYDSSCIQTKGSNSYSNKNFDLLTDNSGKRFIIIKKTDRKGLKLTFKDKPATVKGYIDFEPTNKVGEFSLDNSSIKTTFEYALPLDAEYGNVTKKYRAVDYAGNLSEPLEITYTYKNPHKAQDVQFIPYNSDLITSDLSDDLAADNITLTKSKLNNNTLYYKNGWVLVRCTLYDPGTGTGNNAYVDNPATVKLFNGNTNSQVGGDFTLSGGKLKRYNFGDDNGETGENKRYYCYLALKLDNADFSGKKLYCIISGEETDSDKQPVYSASGSNITWTADNAGPVLNGIYKDDDNVHKLYGYTLYKPTLNQSQQIEYVTTYSPAIIYDSQIGNGYNTLKYYKNSKMAIDSSKITETVGIEAYAFVTTIETSGDKNYNAVAPSDEAQWTKFSNGQSHYEYFLPDITVPHSHLALFLRDAFGNVSDPYYLGHNQSDGDKYYMQWWLMEQTLASTDIEITRNDKTLYVTIPAGQVINSVISADNNLTKVTGVNFTGYKSDGQPEFVQDTGKFKDNKEWIVIDDGTNHGLMVTIDKIPAQTFAAQDVYIKVNNVSVKAFTVEAKALTDSDIGLTLNGNTPAYTPGTSEYTLNITLPSGVTVTSVTSDDATVAWDSQNPATVTISDVTQDWQTKTVNLVINNVTKKVFDVDPRTLNASEVSITSSSPAEWTSGSTYTVTVSAPAGAPINSVKSQIGSSETDLTITGLENGKVAASGNFTVTIPAITKTWDTQTVNIIINKDTNNITKKVFDINPRTLQEGEVSATSNPNTWTSGSTYTVTVNAPAGAPINSVKSQIGETETDLTINGLENGRVGNGGSFTVTLGAITQTWDSQTVNIIINKNNENITKNVLNVSARTLQEGEVSAASNPNTWTSGSAYTVTVTAPAGAKITSVKRKINDTETEMPSNTVQGLQASNENGVIGTVGTGGTFTVTLPSIDKITTAQTVYIVINTYAKELFSIEAAEEGAGGNPGQNFSFYSGLFKGVSPDLRNNFDSRNTFNKHSSEDSYSNDNKAVENAAEETAAVTEAAAGSTVKAAKKAKSAKTARQKAKNAVVSEQTETVALEKTAGVSEASANVSPAAVTTDEEPQTAQTSQTAQTASVIESIASAAEIAPDEHSNAAIWIILCVFVAAIAGLVLCLKKKVLQK